MFVRVKFMSFRVFQPTFFTLLEAFFLPGMNEIVFSQENDNGTLLQCSTCANTLNRLLDSVLQIREIRSNTNHRVNGT